MIERLDLDFLYLAEFKVGKLAENKLKIPLAFTVNF